eukprot:COSAG01_NODE_875_length_12972_cov_61.925503_8_plen_137_part_00
MVLLWVRLMMVWCGIFDYDAACYIHYYTLKFGRSESLNTLVTVLSRLAAQPRSTNRGMAANNGLASCKSLRCRQRSSPRAVVLFLGAASALRQAIATSAQTRPWSCSLPEASQRHCIVLLSIGASRGRADKAGGGG